MGVGRCSREDAVAMRLPSSLNNWREGISYLRHESGDKELARDVG